MHPILLKYILIGLFFLLSLVLSSTLIRFGIPRLTGSIDRIISVWYMDTGFWIGLCENLIIFIFVLHNEFSALAIIFGAKEFVRKDDIKQNPAYYLLGTLVNFGLALTIVELLKITLTHCLTTQ